MKMLAVEDSFFLAVKPSFGGGIVADGTGAVSAGVVPVPFYVPLRARLNVAAERRCSTNRDPTGRFPHIWWQRLVL
jgi:hypothetical protein